MKPLSLRNIVASETYCLVTIEIVFVNVGNINHVKPLPKSYLLQAISLAFSQSWEGGFESLPKTKSWYL